MSANVRSLGTPGTVSYLQNNEDSEEINIQGREVKEPGMFDWLINHPLMNHPTTKMVGAVAVTIFISWAVNQTISWASKKPELSVPIHTSSNSTGNAESSPLSNIALSVFAQKISHSDSPDRGSDDPNGSNPRDPRNDRGRAHEPERAVPDKEHRHRPEKNR